MVDLSGMGKQYHFWPGIDGRDAWDVDRLIKLADGLPIELAELDSIAEIDSVYWFDADHPATVRAVVDQPNGSSGPIRSTPSFLDRMAV